MRTGTRLACVIQTLYWTRGNIEVKFADGATDVFTANQIAKNIYSQIDAEGNSYSIMSEIFDHKSDGTAVQKDDGFEVTKDGTLSCLEGRHLLVVHTAEGLESQPIQVAEYAAVANKILEEPVFKWWARHILKKCGDRIIKKVKSR